MVTDLFPMALGVAISPLPVAVTLVLLLSVRASTVGWGFSLGFAGGIAAATTTAALLYARSPSASGDHGEPVGAWVRVAVGFLLLVLGVLRVVRHAHGDPAVAAPRWLTTLDNLTFRRAIALGLVLAVANPKNLPIALTAGVTIAAAELSSGVVPATVGLFVLAATSTVLAPVIAYRIAPGRVAGLLQWIRRWLIRRGNTALTTVLLVVGALVLAQGLTRL